MKKVLIALAMVLLSPAFAHAAFDSDLKYGSTGSKVLELQEFLAAQGVYSGPITGNFYSLTLAGVKAFQEKHNVSPVSGYFGPLTRGVANDLLAVELEASNEEAGQTPVVEEVQLGSEEAVSEPVNVVSDTWETNVTVKRGGVDEDGNLYYEVRVSGTYDKVSFEVARPDGTYAAQHGLNAGPTGSDVDVEVGKTYTWKVVSQKGKKTETQTGQFTAE
jgi:peptidoglycan hydrolase-like protein with peptidoglycan-binding domain